MALHLSKKKLPLLDLLRTFDQQNTQYIYRSDFHGPFIDNYLGMQWNAKTGEGLSKNEKMLLTSKYAASQSVISFPFSGFVEDIRKTAEDGRIRVFME